jgi:hypothetical protein
LTILSIVGGYLVLVLIDGFSNQQHQTLCLFKSATGIPCPGCGMGRATLELIKGNIALSFNYNILCIPFSLSIIISLVWLLSDIIKREETFFRFIKQDIRAPYRLLLLTLIFLDWSVNILRNI